MIGFINIYKAQSHPNKTLYNHMKEIIWFSEELKNLGFKFNEKYLKILALFHDIGKMYKPFQDYLKGKENKIKHSGPSSVLFFLIMQDKSLLKNLMLEEVVKELNVSLDLSEEKIKIFTYLILVHHSDLKVLRKGDLTSNHYQNFFTNFENPWKEYLKQYNLFDEYEKAVTTKINIKDTNSINEFLNSYAVFKICDRLSGSFHRNLRKDKIPKILYKFGILDLDFEIDKETLLYLLNKISGEVNENKLNDQIKFLNEKVNILLAPTGFGKTTFSIFKGINKNKRLLIALPTITSIKQFLGRTKKIVNEIGYFSDIVGTYFYFYNPFKSSEENENLILNEYFLSRYLMKPIMITTVDQLLLTYLQTKEYYIKRLALQNRLLIIDEIHLLSPKILFFLLQFLKEYKNLFKDLVFMSATFPTFLRELIENELDLSKASSLLLYNYYPKNRIQIEFLDENLEIKKEKKEGIFEEIYNKIKELSKEKQKIIVLFNTVNNAQEFYKFLKEKKENWKLLLFHSRFIYKHRKKKEKKVVSLNKNKLNKPFILITTQVVEVSLDIDFDYLITELAPLPEMIQRFGRVFRNRKKEELPPKNPNIFIFGFFEESKKIYDEELIKASYKILKNFKGLVNEEELIKKLDESSEFKNSFLRNFEDAKKDYSNLLNKWLNEHSNRFYYLFTEEDEEKSLEEISKLLNIRDSINALVFVNEEDLSKKEKEKYKYLINNLKESKIERNFVKFFKTKLHLREFSLSLPFYYISEIFHKIDKERQKVPMLPSGIYNEEFGIDTKKLKEKGYLGEEMIIY